MTQELFLPRFDRTPEQTKAEVLQVLAENRASIQRLLAEPITYWEDFFLDLEDLDDALENVWSPLRHLHSVTSTSEWREVYQALLPEISNYYSELGQNQDLYHCFQRACTEKIANQLSPARRRAISLALQNFRLTGIALPAEEQKRLRELQQELSLLESRFDNQLNDARQAWEELHEEKHELAGLPAWVFDLLRQNAHNRQHEGYLLTLDFPIYYHVMRYAENRELRARLHRAYQVAASDLGAAAYDNTALLEEILRKRQQKAELLGFGNFAELALVQRMAESPSQVQQFLENLLAHAKAKWQTEWQTLQDFAQSLGLDVLKPWDLSYVTEKYRQKHLDFSEDEVKPYFPFEVFMAGVSKLLAQVFGVELRQAEAAVWHPEVRFYELRDAKTQELLGALYLDPYARQQKRQGAWMDVAKQRFPKVGSMQLPVAYLVCNFTPPVAGKPTLLNHEEVLTFLHELGHGLQHLLTTVEVPSVAGLQAIEWDAVELASQFMEHWAWELPSLALLSAHVESQEALPAALLNKLKRSREAFPALALCRQLEFSLFDFYLHQQNNSHITSEQVHELWKKTHEQANPLPLADYQRLAQSFSHVFAGGYAAGYYSYLWAEVMAADAFAAFRADGVLSATLGQRFRETVLALGAALPSREIYRRFRGRDAELHALLQERGIVEPA
jgi:oligopeptidase A